MMQTLRWEGRVLSHASDGALAEVRCVSQAWTRDGAWAPSWEVAWMDADLDAGVDDDRRAFASEASARAFATWHAETQRG